MSWLQRSSRWSFARFAFLVSLACFAFGASAAWAQATVPTYRPGEVLIKFAPSASPADIQSIRGDLGATQLTSLSWIGASRERIARYSVEAAIARYRADSRVAFIEPNYILKADRIPNDALFSQLWGMQNTGQTGGTPGADIRATNAWDITTGSSSVLVAIIDTGMDYTHPDLAANVWTNPGEIPGNGIDDDGNGFVDDIHGWDFVNGDNNPMDDHGHGTHVSGTIGAIGDNGIGVAGVNWTVKIMALKFLDAGGSGSTSGAIQAVQYATQMGVRIMSNSWGGGGYSEALRLAIQTASDAGILFVAAAGNSASDNDVSPHYPSSYDVPLVIAVASTDHNDVLSYFSCYGLTSVDLAAPGSSILSTMPGNSYGTMSGTSMATPHVSGALALMLARFPAMSGTDAKQRLLMSVDALPSLAGKILTGGRLNVFTMLAEPDSLPPAAIGDLSVAAVNGDWATLAWTATGDDGTVGRASRYDLRYSTSPITPENFDAATPAPGPPNPQPAGSPETARVSGLAFGTDYWFAIKAIDEFSNPSPMSNVASGTTLAAPHITVAPDSLTAELYTGASTTRTLEIANTGPSDLSYRISYAGTEALLAGAHISRRFSAAGPGGGLRGDAGGETGGTRDYDAGASPMRPPLVPALQPDGLAATAASLRILMVNSGGDDSEIRGQLAALPDIAAVDEFDASTVVPTLDLLRQYHAAIVVANRAPGDPTGIGNVLADYVDEGGGVVLTLASFVNGYNIGGRLLTGGYFPFTLGSGPVGASTLGTFDPAHPIMHDVTTLSGDLLGQTEPAPGAQLVASYVNGLPLVATQGRHVVGLNLFFGGSGYWLGDVPTLVHNAVLWSGGASPWLSAAPTQGIVAAGTTVDVTVTFDAADLFGGDYRSDVVVESNDPDQSTVRVPAHLHVIGAPDIALSDSVFAFGDLFVGGVRTDSLVVRNAGTDLLDVTSLSTDQLVYSVQPTSFQLPPGETQVVLVSFTPSEPGPITGTLTVLSNDPDEATLTLPLSGTGLVPPDIAVTPDSLTADLITGEQTTRTLTIANTGLSDLRFQVSVQSPLLASRLVVRPLPRLPEGWPAAGVAGGLSTDRLPSSFVPARPAKTVTDGALVLIVEDELPWGMNANEQILSANGIAYDVIPSTQLATTDLTRYRVLLVPSVQPTQLYATLAAQSAQIENFVYRGGVLEFHASGQSSGSDPWLVTLPGGLRIEQHYANTNHVLLAGHPLVVGIPEPFTGTYASHSSLYSIPANAEQVAADDSGQTNLVVYRFGSGRVIASGQTLEFAYNYGWNGGPILANMIPYALSLAGGGWLSTAPNEGVVPAGGSVDVTATFDATGLFGGDYRADVLVESNDPDESGVRVPAHLRVTGAPDIALSDSLFAFGDLFVGAVRTDTLRVSNVGTDLLDVTSLSTDLPVFSVQPVSFQLTPGQSQIVLVSFAPTAPGPFTGTLTILSTDPGEPTLALPLSGSGLVPPDIAVTPDSLSVDLYTGEHTTRALTVANTGGSDLRFSASVQLATFASTSSVAVRPEGLRSRAAAGVREDGSGVVGPRGPGGLQPLLLSRLQRLGSAGVIFYDDVEHGDNGWARQVFGPDDLWHRSTRAFNSPSTSWWCGIEATGDYATGNRINTAVVSPPIDLTHSVAPVTLEFFETFQTESGWDFCRVEVSADSGTSWTPLRNAPSGDSGGWRLSALDLSPWAGQSIRVRFYFDTGDGVANNYPGWFFDDVLVSGAMNWISIAPEQGTVSPGGSLEVTATFDASGLLAGDYRADVVLESNDPDESTVSVPTHLHVTGAPNIVLSDSSFAFGVLFIGASRTDSLHVSNTGTDRLDVTSLSTDVPAYSVLPASFQLDAGQSQWVLVRFAPATPGPAPGVLTILSNDPDEPTLALPLSGTGLVPPDLVVTPDSLTAALHSGAKMDTVIHLVNRGGSNLYFTIGTGAGALSVPVHAGLALGKGEPDPRPGILGSGGPDQFGYRWRDSDEPDGPLFSWVDITGIGSLLPLSGDDATLAGVPLGFSFPFYGSTFSTVNVSTNGFLSFTSTGAPYANQPLPNLDAPENLLAALWDDLYVQAPSIYAYHDSTRFIVSYVGVPRLSGGGPYTFQVILYPSGRIQYQYLSSVGGWDTDATVGIQNATRNDGLTVEYNTTYLHDNLAVELGAVPRFLTAAPEAGTIPAGDSLDVTATLDAAGLPGGDYRNNLAISSNDPDQAVVIVPAQLHVIAAEPPEVVVSPTAFQEVLGLDQSLSEELALENRGGTPLSWNVEVAFADSSAVTQHIAARASSGAPVARKEVLTAPPPAPDRARLVSPRIRAEVEAARPARQTGPSAGVFSGSPPALAVVLGLLNDRYTTVTDSIPDRYDFDEGVTGTFIDDGGLDMFDGGNFLETERGGPVEYSNLAISSSPAFGDSAGIYFTAKYPGLFVLAADLRNVESFTISGNLGADGEGHVDGAELEVTHRGTLYRGYVKRVYQAGDASVNHLIIVPEPGATSHVFSDNTDDDFDQVNGLGTSQRIYYLLYAAPFGQYIGDAATLAIMRAFIAAVTPPQPPWLVVTPSSGVVPPYSTARLAATFDSHGLEAGLYDAHLFVHSNDPAEPVVEVPASLLVDGGSVAIEVSLVSSAAEPGVARVVWYAAKAGALTGTVYRRTEAGDWAAFGAVRADGEGYLRFEDHDVTAGQRYGYRLGVVEDGTERFVGEVWVELPPNVSFALHGLKTNPAVREIIVSFSLPDARPATLELLDISGRRVVAQEVGSLGLGRHAVTLGAGMSHAPGVYLVRLRRAGQAFTVRAVVIR